MTSKYSFAQIARNYALPLAIGFGTLIFFALRYVPLLNKVGPLYEGVINAITPYLIFVILYTSFCRVELRQMKPKKWHLALLIFQVGLPCLLTYFIVQNPTSPWRVELEGAIACIITPTAAAAAAVGTKLGCNESAMTSYTIISNLQASMFIPLLFPLIGSQVASSFSEGFLLIATKVFPLIVLPLILAFITRHAFKKLHHFIVVKLKDLGFYVWAITLLSVTGVAWGNIIDTTVDSLTLVFLIFIGFLTTGAQFGFGKFVGQLEGQRISAGQSLGQKNMVFGIWCTSSFLNPAAAIAPGCYLLWQNLVNGVQLAYKGKFDKKREKLGLGTYQE